MRHKLSFLPLLVLLGCSSPAPPPATTAADPSPVDAPSSILKTVRYPSGKDTVGGLVCSPAVEGTFPGVVLIHDALGMTDGTREQLDRLARCGYVVMAVDLYRGEKPQSLMEAHILDRGLPEDRVRQDLKAAVDYLAQRTNVKVAALGVVGLGMGGGYALEAALHDPRLRAVVNCYGPLITDAKLLEPLKASVFCLLAGKDEGFSADTVTHFCKAMDRAGKRVWGIRVFGECHHGFLDPANWPTYGKPSPDDVKEAWELIGKYLDQELKAPASGQSR